MDIKKDKAKIFSIFLVIICISVGTLVVFTQVFEREELTGSDVFSDYQSMLDNIGEPVSNPTIPTITHVISWLRTDVTDRIPYEENVWECGGYSATLVINAKEMNWRIYVVILCYSFDGGAGYGERSPSGDYGHAFNLIYCQDGDDLDSELDVWYIEPQSDGVWQLNYDHYTVYTYYSGGLVKTIWSTTYWVNYYFYFG